MGKAERRRRMLGHVVAKSNIELLSTIMIYYYCIVRSNDMG